MKTRDRLLLVDDHKDHLEMLAVILSERYEVAAYGLASDALAALESFRPNVALLDIGMRPIDGLQCLEAIRATPGFSKIPAVAVTAYARDTERQTFLAAGFQAVVTKPVLDVWDLVDVIDRVLASPIVTPRTLTRRADNGILTARGDVGASTPGVG